MAKELRTLGWDYLMFVLFIMFSVFAPLWKRLFGKKKQRSKADYVFATGGISIIAIMLSIARGTLGVRTILGYPSELFYRGSAMWEIIYGMVCAYPIVCFIFVPVYFNLGITSVYQYIDLRFKSRLVRCLASATYIVRQICSLGVTVYTPCVALATVIGVPYWVSITGMSTICIFFTITGGLKAAINADVIQTVTVIFVTLTVIVRGAMQSGGPKRVYEVNRDNGRLKFFTFTGDMTTRVDTTSALLGQLFVSLSQFGCQQNFMQRYVSLKSLKQVNRAMMSNIPIIFIFFSLSWISGMVIYSTYVDCDPYADGYLQKQDEILPFFVEDQLSFIPGFLGIFLATLFNGALCMMVSNLNSVATVCWEDFVSLLPQFKGLSDKQQLGIIKFITIVCGLVVMGAAFGVGMFTGVIESSLLAFSATSGPLLACFVLAMLVPFANWKGTSAGMVASCAFVLWIIGGSFTLDKTDKNATFLPTSTEGCTNDTFSAAIERPAGEVSWLMSHTPIDNGTVAMASMAGQKAASPLDSFYAISYMYYSLIGTFVAIGVGILVSWFTQDPKDAYDSKLLHPMVFRLCQRFGGINKPYFISESENVLNTVPNAGTNASAGSNINHAFDSHNEANIIIGSKAADKDKHQIEVIFTAPPSITATASPDTEAAADVKMLNMTNGGGLIIGANLSKLDSNPINEEDAKNGSYRTLNDRDIV